MRRSVSTGEDFPGRVGVRQRTFLCLPNSVGKLLSVETPEPFGPRKRLQSSAGAETMSVNSRSGNHRVLGTRHIVGGSITPEGRGFEAADESQGFKISILRSA